MQARALLDAGRLTEFERRVTELQDYALLPYLHYFRVSARLERTAAPEVAQFINTHEYLPAVALLRKRWFRHLGKTRQWSVLREHYVDEGDAELQCFYLRARYAAGETEAALDETTALWSSPLSQPKSCDPLFDLWRATPRFTPAVIWQRYRGALEADERTLARYLRRFFFGRGTAAGGPFLPGSHTTRTHHPRGRLLPGQCAYPRDYPPRHRITGTPQQPTSSFSLASLSTRTPIRPCRRAAH